MDTIRIKITWASSDMATLIYLRDNGQRIIPEPIQGIHGPVIAFEYTVLHAADHVIEFSLVFIDIELKELKVRARRMGSDWRVIADEDSAKDRWNKSGVL